MGLFDKLLNKKERDIQFDKKSIDYGEQQANHQQTGDPLEDYLSSVIRPINESAEQKRTSEDLKNQGYEQKVEHSWQNSDFVSHVPKTKGNGYYGGVELIDNKGTLPEYYGGKNGRDYDGDGFEDCREYAEYEYESQQKAALEEYLKKYE